MGLNNFNLGFTFTAQDMVSGVASGVQKSIHSVEQGLQGAQESIQKTFFGMQSGMMIMQKGMQVLGGITKPIQSFMGFEAAMAEVSTLVDTSVVSMSDLSDQVLELSDRFGVMPVDMAKALYSTISAGFADAADAAIVLDQANKLAIGGVTDTNNALKGMTATLKAWNLEADQAGAVSDAMFVAMKAGQTTVGDLSSNIGNVSSIAAQAGLTFEEVLGATSALTLGGRTTSAAMTGLKSVLTAVIKGSKQSTDIAKKLGIEFNVAAIKAMGFEKWIKHVTEQVNGDERAMAKLFGRVEGIGAIFSLGGKQAGDFASIMEGMKNKAGETDVAYTKMTRTMSFQFKKLKASFEVLKIQIGKALAPVFALLMRALNAVISGAKWLIKRLPILAKLFGVLIGMVGGLIVLAGAFIVVKFAIMGVTIALNAMMASFAPVLIAALPIVAALAVLIGIGYALKKAYEHNLGGFADGLKVVWYWVDLVIGSMWEMLTTGQIVGKRVEGVISTGWLYDLIQVIAWVRMGFVQLFSGIKAGFKAVGNVFSPFVVVFEQLGGVINRITAIFAKFWGGADGGTKGKDATKTMQTIKMIGVGIGIVFASAAKMIAFAIATVIRGVGFLVEVIMVAFASIQKFFGGIIKVMTGDWKGGLKDMWQALTGWISGILNAMGAFIWDIIAGFLELFGISIGSWEDFKDSVIGIFVSMWEGIKEIFDFLVDSAIEIGRGVAAPFIAAANLVSDKWNGIASWFVKLWEGITKPLKDAWDGFTEIFTLAGKSLKKMWTPIYEWFKKKLGWIISAAEKVYGVGKKVWGGIKSMGSGIKNIITGGDSIADLEQYLQKKKAATPNEFFTEGLPDITDNELAGMDADRKPGGPETLARMPAVAQAELQKKAAQRPIQVVVNVPKQNINVDANLKIDGETLAKASEAGTQSLNENRLTTTVPATS